MVWVEIFLQNDKFGYMSPVLGKLEATHDLCLWLYGNIKYHTIPKCDGQTDRQTDGRADGRIFRSIYSACNCKN